MTGKVIQADNRVTYTQRLLHGWNTYDMTFIEVDGAITEDGKLDVHVQLPAGTPAGKVSVIVVVEPELDDDDDAIWDEAFRSTQAELQEMATRVSALRKAGLTKPFDPDVDLDENGEVIQ